MGQRFEDGVWVGGFDPWANVSLGLALLSYVALVVEWTGVFHDSCGGYDLNCAAYGVLALALGCTLGTIAALASFRTQRQRAYSWFVLLLNGVPGIPCAVLVVWFLTRQVTP